MMSRKENVRGVPIGGYPSQPIANLTVSKIDHHMKEVVHCKCYLRNNDDTVGLARSKAEAWAQFNEYDRLSSELGLLVKASYIVAPIAHKTYGKQKRKRQRGAGHKRKKD